MAICLRLPDMRLSDIFTPLRRRYFIAVFVPPPEAPDAAASPLFSFDFFRLLLSCRRDAVIDAVFRRLSLAFAAFCCSLHAYAAAAAMPPRFRHATAADAAACASLSPPCLFFDALSRQACTAALSFSFDAAADISMFRFCYV